MAQINHVNGKKYRVCVDSENDVYDELSFIEDASDVKFTDGTDAESNLGQIKGITSDVTGEAENVAASIKVVNQLNNSLSDINQWKELLKATGTASTNIPNDAKEILCTCYNANVNIGLSIILPIKILDDKTKRYVSGWSPSSSGSSLIEVYISKSSISNLKFFVSNSDHTSDTEFTIFYK